MGRCRVEPNLIAEIAEQEFRGNQKAFLDAFGRSLPDFSRTELAWKLDNSDRCFSKNVKRSQKA